jgi:hypothetical protein
MSVRGLLLSSWACSAWAFGTESWAAFCCATILLAAACWADALGVE